MWSPMDAKQAFPSVFEEECLYSSASELEQATTVLPYLDPAGPLVGVGVSLEDLLSSREAFLLASKDLLMEEEHHEEGLRRATTPSTTSC